MKVIGLDGRDYNLNLKGKEVRGEDFRQRSNPHLTTRKLLRSLFPFSPILEEIPLPGTGTFKLVADFFLPHQRLIVEVQGKQHFQHSSLFHKKRGDFAASQVRDGNKAKWCSINNLRLVTLLDTEDEDEWRRRIFGEDGEGD